MSLLVGSALLVHVVEDALGGVFLLEVDHAVRVTRHKGKIGPRVEAGGRLLELGQQEKGHQKGRDDVDRPHPLVVLGPAPVEGRDARILQQHIEPGQLGRHPRGEGLDALIAAQVHSAYLDEAGIAAGGLFNVAFRSFAFLDRSHRHDEFGGTELDYLPGRFKAQSCIGARDNDGFPRIRSGLTRYLAKELVPDEPGQNDRSVSRHLCGDD